MLYTGLSLCDYLGSDHIHSIGFKSGDIGWYQIFFKFKEVYQSTVYTYIHIYFVNLYI